MVNIAVKKGYSKRLVLIIFVCCTIVIAVISYNLINKIQYQQSYQEISLNIIKKYDFDMSQRPDPYWISITNRGQVEEIKKKFNWDLPDIDFAKEMFVISYGSELEMFRYNLKESTFKTRGKYIGFPHFKHEKSQNTVFIYRTVFIPLMDTDEAGYPPNYKGK